MKRIVIAILIGLGLQTCFMFGVHGHFGPCGPSDAFGDWLFLSAVPGAWMADQLHLHGIAEDLAIFLVPVPVYAGLVWLGIAGVSWFRRWNASGPEPRTPPAGPKSQP